LKHISELISEAMKELERKSHHSNPRKSTKHEPSAQQKQKLAEQTAALNETLKLKTK